MVFCGHCGYQLSPGDQTCPRCGAKTEVETIELDPGAYNPTEVSRAVVENLPTRSVTPAERANALPQQGPAEQAGPLILGPVDLNEQLANATTTMMDAHTYAPQQQAYPGYGAYPQQTSVAGYGPGYPAYQPGQSDAVAQILEASRKGKIASLLLILFGLLLLIGAIVVFLLNQQSIIF